MTDEGDDLRPEKALAWPPTAEDLRRLYIDEHLSAAKIAARYGLKYDSPKTAESTVLYHLKRNGITRRGKADLARKTTEEMADAWVRRYAAGESLKQIAGNEFSPVTVYLHLKKRGVQLRDKVEAQIQAVTKHQKAPFNGDPHLKHYMIGITVGDYWVTDHGRATRVKLGTTHPAMAWLFKELFGKYGPIYEYPRRAQLTGYEWSLDCDLDSSFEFLTDSKSVKEEIFEDRTAFLDFLSGFFDAEGSIYFHNKNGAGSFEWSLANSNQEIVTRISTILSGLGYHPKVRVEEPTLKRIYRGGKMASTLPMWRVALWRHEEVRQILEVLPIRHPEKIAKAKIARGLPFRPNFEVRERILSEWEILKSQIESDVRAYIDKAREEIRVRPGGHD